MYSKSTFVFTRHFYAPLFPANIFPPILQLKPAPPISTATLKLSGRLFWSDSLDLLLSRSILHKHQLFQIISVITLRLIEHHILSTRLMLGANSRSYKYHLHSQISDPCTFSRVAIMRPSPTNIGYVWTWLKHFKVLKMYFKTAPRCLGKYA